mmetsp:Transcript_3246/g.10161  ORF Transcript_3246/g.10161 Transcript_3246/m.10161 type:complete len:307 (-) Transcript_3246:70-990(-)
MASPAERALVADHGAAFLRAAGALLDPQENVHVLPEDAHPEIVALVRSERNSCPRRRALARGVASARGVSRLWRDALAARWRLSSNASCPETCGSRVIMREHLLADTRAPFGKFMRQVEARERFYSISRGLHASFAVRDLVRGTWFLRRAIFQGADAVATVDAFAEWHVDASSGGFGSATTTAEFLGLVFARGDAGVAMAEAIPMSDERKKMILREAVMDSANKLISNFDQLPRLYGPANFLLSWLDAGHDHQLPCSFISDTLVEKYWENLSAITLDRHPILRERRDDLLRVFAHDTDDSDDNGDY